MRCNLLVASLAAGIFLFAARTNAAIIHDDFEVDSSANYTIVNDGSPDGTQTFAFDYIGAGIPLAPNSALGDKGGLKMTANDTSPGDTDAFTAFHDTIINLSEYRLQVDVYMGVTGTTGTTEHAHIGVAGNGTTFNSLFSPISGSGHYLAFDGEGGSSSDYRHFTPSAASVPSGDLSYLNSTNTTNSTGDTYQALFPGTAFPGSPTNIWTTLEIEILGGKITYLLDGTPIIQDDVEVTNGYVSLGYGDLFTSVAAPAQSMFVIFDNLSVVVPEPSSLLFGLAAAFVGLVCRRR